MTTRYLLPEGVYACFTSDGTIFLDVRRDRYVGLDHQKTRLLRSLVTEDGERSSDREALAAELVEQRLLTTRGDRARPFAPSSIPLPKDALLNFALDDEPRVRLGHVVRFVQACIATWLALRCCSLQYAIRRRRTNEATLPQDVDPVRARELASIFVRLRPIFYVARNHCLFDSFALAEFLSHYCVRSTCVFGVTTLPFAAHCWVQIGTFVVDGTPATIARFSPILAV